MWIIIGRIGGGRGYVADVQRGQRVVWASASDEALAFPSQEAAQQTIRAFFTGASVERNQIEVFEERGQ